MTLKKIIGVGIPAGVQSTLFALANTLGQSAVNSFGKVVMAAHAASNNVQGIIHTPMSTLDQATLAFTSQNLGAKRIDNIRKVERKSVLINAVSSLIIALIAFTIGGTLLKIYNVDSEEMMQAALTHMHIVTATAGLGTLMCVYAALMRGIGYSVKPTVVTLIGSCLLRVLWILFLLPLNHKLGFLYIVYPITWIVTTAVHFVCFRRGLRKTERRLAAGDDI